MSTFVYQAMAADGSQKSGNLEAGSRAEAYRLLDRQRLQPVSLELAGAKALKKEKKGKSPSATTGKEATPTGPLRLSKPQIVSFTEELSDLLDAGLQLEAALKIIEERQSASAVKRAATQLRQLVRDGTSFSESLRRVSPSFGELYCSLVSAGELSGALPKILKRQVEYLNVIADLRSKIIQALIYPSFIVGAGILLMVLFMAVLVPQLMELFEKSDKALPLLTRILIGGSNLITGYWWAILLIIASFAGGFWLILRQPEGREWWDETRLKIPLFGRVFRSGFLAQFCQTLANLVGNGLPLLTGLQLMERATGNSFLRKKIERVSAIVADGGALSKAMQRTGWFPAVFIDLVSVGEQTGDIANSLEKAAARYEKDMNRRIERITALIQPVVIVVIAVVVGAVIYSIITSIFEAISSMRAG